MGKKKNTIIYSCSGCSNLAQLANALAVKLDREKKGTMSCVAGLGGDVVSLVKIAKEAEEVLIIDGCQLSCGLHCFRRHSDKEILHLRLTDFNLAKKNQTDFSKDDFDQVYEKVLEKMR